MPKQENDMSHLVCCHTWEKLMDRFDHYFEMHPLLGGIEPGSVTLLITITVAKSGKIAVIVFNVTDPGSIPPRRGGIAN